jgi:hypothetical protein
MVMNFHLPEITEKFAVWRAENFPRTPRELISLFVSMAVPCVSLISDQSNPLSDGLGI